MTEKEVINVLKEWVVSYVKHRDMITKSIVNIKEDQDKVIVKFKDKEKVFLIMPIVNDSVIEKINKDKNTGIIILNSKENLGFLIDNWKKLVKFENLKFFFVNPFSEPDKKWFISPYIHNKICDEDSLKLGLKTMFETVETITEKEILKK
jgi:predicted lipase